MSGDEIDETLRDLRRGYLASFPEKREALKSAWRKVLGRDRRDPAWLELYALAHRLVGSAGAHELNAVAEAAARVERLMDEAEVSLAAIEQALGDLDRTLAAGDSETVD
jgi:HPt (histidine-containing phosphotransfer) domain-containing protein